MSIHILTATAIGSILAGIVGSDDASAVDSRIDTIGGADSLALVEFELQLGEAANVVVPHGFVERHDTAESIAVRLVELSVDIR